MWAWRDSHGANDSLPSPWADLKCWLFLPPPPHPNYTQASKQHKGTQKKCGSQEFTISSEEPRYPGLRACVWDASCQCHHFWRGQLGAHLPANQNLSSRHEIYFQLYPWLKTDLAGGHTKKAGLSWSLVWPKTEEWTAPVGKGMDLHPPQTTNTLRDSLRGKTQLRHSSTTRPLKTECKSQVSF